MHVSLNVTDLGGGGAYFHGLGKNVLPEKNTTYFIDLQPGRGNGVKVKRYIDNVLRPVPLVLKLIVVTRDTNSTS